MASRGVLSAMLLAALCASVSAQQTLRPATRPAGPAALSSVSFKLRIQPVLDAQCVACHQTGAASADLNLEEGEAYAALVRQSSLQSKLQRVAPGKPADSYLLHKLEGSHIGAGGQGSQMPLLGPLSKDEIALIRQWIMLGAPDN